MLDKFVVHPAYQRSGHAKKLIDWGSKLADMDKMKVGVCAPDSSKENYEKRGFAEVKMVSGKHIRITFLERKPGSGGTQ